MLPTAASKSVSINKVELMLFQPARNVSGIENVAIYHHIDPCGVSAIVIGSLVRKWSTSKHLGANYQD